MTTTAVPTDLAGSEQAVLDAVASGQISEGRIDQSVTRLLRLKLQLGLASSPQVDVSAVASPGRHAAGQIAVQNAAADRSITLLRNRPASCRSRTGSSKSVLVTGYGVSTTANLATAITAQGVTTTRVVTGSAPGDAAIAAAVAAAKDADYVVDVSYNAWSSLEQRSLAEQLPGHWDTSDRARRGRPVRPRLTPRRRRPSWPPTAISSRRCGQP